MTKDEARRTALYQRLEKIERQIAECQRGRDEVLVEAGVLDEPMPVTPPVPPPAPGAPCAERRAWLQKERERIVQRQAEDAYVREQITRRIVALRERMEALKAQECEQLMELERFAARWREGGPA